MCAKKMPFGIMLVRTRCDYRPLIGGRPDAWVRMVGTAAFDPILDDAYLALATGSIPLFLIASAASGEAKNAINRLALSTCPEPATIAAENT